MIFTHCKYKITALQIVHGFLNSNLVPVNFFHFSFMNGFRMVFHFAHYKRIKSRNWNWIFFSSFTLNGFDFRFINIKVGTRERSALQTNWSYHYYFCLFLHFGIGEKRKCSWNKFISICSCWDDGDKFHGYLALFRGR